MISDDLNTNLILQDSCTTCGPAVAAMALNLNAGVLREIAREIGEIMRRNPSPKFFTSPEALSELMTRRMGRRFRVERRRDAASLNSVIVNVVRELDSPVPVLVLGCGHWLIVSGYIHSGEPGQIRLSSMIVDDPANPCIDCRGMGRVPELCVGGTYNGAYVDLIPLVEWRALWLTGCTVRQESEFVCIVPDVEIESLQVVVDSTQEGGPGHPVGFEHLGECISLAKAQYGLDHHAVFGDALEGAGIRKAMQVSMDGGGYYIVEMARGHEGVTGLVLIRAATGGLMGVRAFKQPIRRFIPEEGSANSFRSAIHAWRIDHGLNVDLENNFRLDSPLRWVPSREFRSPYFPYFEVQAENARIYLGLNGLVYGELREIKA